MATGYLIKIGVYIHGLALGGKIKSNILDQEASNLATDIANIISHIEDKNTINDCLLLMLQ